MEASELNRSGTTPEDMFLAWFLGLPGDVDIKQAAQAEIARIDRIPGPKRQLESLRGLLHQATLNMPYQTPRRRQRRH